MSADALPLPPDTTFAALPELQKNGRYLDAWRLIENHAAPEQWPDLKQRIRGAALLERLGAGRRAEKMIFKSWKKAAEREAVLDEMFWEVLHYRGSFLAWKWLLNHAPKPEANSKRWADFYGQKAILLIRLRDFQRAQECLRLGLKTGHYGRWFRLLEVDVWQAQDERERALKLCLAVLKDHPTYVNAYTCTADLFIELGKDEEAISVLEQGLPVVQSGLLPQRLANLHLERKQYEKVPALLSLYEEWMPLRESGHENWLASVRCDLASAEKNLEQTLHWARKVTNSGFHTKLVKKLEESTGREWRQVRLPVPFVKQHESTCAPASLTSIALYWGVKVDHVDVADDICYDGTPDHRERDWAEKMGWVVREFKVTVESAQLLIDQGMPFILNTYYPGGAHAQVVMGYDDRRSVLFIRDPGNRHTSEFLAIEALEEQQPFGPRGFVMVPAEHQEKLQALILPETTLYDHLHVLHHQLFRHERTAAQQALDALREAAPDHLMRWRGELSLARYDGHLAHQLQALESMLAQFPDVVDWRTSRLSLIQQLHGYDTALVAARKLCEEPKSHPQHWVFLARELLPDQRNLPELSRWLQRIHRKRLDGEAIQWEGDLLWRKQAFAEATEHYRLAACLNFRHQPTVMTYFKAARSIHQTEEALSMMQQRYENEGLRSSDPAVTLYKALDLLKRSAEGIAVLEESLKKRPDDADHAVYVASELALWNRLPRAEEILSQVKQRARSFAWHQAQAQISRMRGDRVAQLKHQQAILADYPLHVEAHRSIAWLLDLEKGEPSGLHFLEEACVRYPCHWQLHIAKLDWARGGPTEAWEKAVRDLLRIDPRDAFAMQQMADFLRQQKQEEEAHHWLDEATKAQPKSVTVLCLRGSVYESQNKRKEAHLHYQQAVQIEVDHEPAQRGLVRTCENQTQRQQALRFIATELERQTTVGDALLEFYSLAQSTYDEAELEKALRAAHAARPDLWQTSTLLSEHLRRSNRVDEATTYSQKAIQRFSLSPRVWMEHALNLEKRGQRAEGILAMEKVRELNPGWSWGMRALSEMQRNEGRYHEAKSTLEEVIRHQPLDAINHGWLAEVELDLKEKSRALESLKKAVSLDPDYGWAWNMLQDHSEDEPSALREAAEQLLKDRPGEARSWIIAADRLYSDTQLEKRLQALDRAQELDPMLPRAADLKAFFLAQAGRFDEALRVCREHPSQSVDLRFREGWLLHQKGEGAAAIKALEAAVEIDARYAWPWKMLIEFHEENKNYADAERACRQLARVEPDEPVPQGYLANLLIAQKKMSEAKDVLHKAVQHFPHYLFAFRRLFWLHMDDKEWRAAKDLLELRKDFFPKPYLTSLQSSWHLRQKEWRPCLEKYEELLSYPDAESTDLGILIDEFNRIPSALTKKLVTPFFLVCKRLLPGQNDHLGKHYTQLCRVLNLLPDKKLLQTLKERPEARIPAYVDAIEWVSERYRAAPRDNFILSSYHSLAHKKWLQNMISEEKEFLRGDEDLYGSVSYALVNFNQSPKVISWLSDWEKVPFVVRPYMLNNLVLALQICGRDEKAFETSLKGTALNEHNSIKLRFHLWCAIEYLLREEAAPADAIMTNVNSGQLDDLGQKLYRFYETLRLHFPDREAPANTHAVKNRIEEFWSYHENSVTQCRSAKRACKLIGKKRASWLLRNWPWLRQIKFLSS